MTRVWNSHIMFLQKMTISFLLGLNLNVTQRNIKLHNITRRKQNVAKGTAANAAAVSFIVPRSQLCRLWILEMHFLYSDTGLLLQLNEEGVIAFFNGTKISRMYLCVAIPGGKISANWFGYYKLCTGPHSSQSTDSSVLLHSRAEKYLFIS